MQLGSWESSERICEGETQRSLFLTACNSTQFACWDGGCVSILQRCDGEEDCQDQSDEQEPLLCCKPAIFCN